jgi:hypothetical protein
MPDSASACCIPADQYFVKAYNQINGNIEQRRETIASSAWKPALKVWCLARNMQRIGMEDLRRFASTCSVEPVGTSASFLNSVGGRRVSYSERFRKHGKPGGE